MFEHYFLKILFLFLSVIFVSLVVMKTCWDHAEKFIMIKALTLMIVLMQ